MTRTKSTFLALLAVLLSPMAANAVPITITHTGSSGSGTLDGAEFSSLDFTITAIADTDNVQDCGGSCRVNDNISATIAIDTLGTFEFLVDTRYFANVGIVGLTRGNGFGDLFDGPATGAWDMVSSIGPVSGAANLLQWGSGDILTTGGTLIFSDQEVMSVFTATVGAVPVPEPGTLALLGLGLVGMAARRRKAV